MVGKVTRQTLRAPKYSCFISYSHSDNRDADRKWANWLHQSLEHYEIPPTLAGTLNEDGKTIPSSLYPVFRDEEELSAGEDLSGKVRNALDNSNALIVICSPRTVRSTYVAEEILYFKKLGRERSIFVMLVEGDPAAREGAEDDSLPAPLRRQVDGQTGKLTSEPAPAPLIADLRTPGGGAGWTRRDSYRRELRSKGLSGRELDSRVDGYASQLEVAKLKLIAGLLETPLNLLTEREQAYQASKRKQLEREALRTMMVFLAAPIIMVGMVLSLHFRHLWRLGDMGGEHVLLFRYANLVETQFIMDIVGGALVLTGLLVLLAVWRLGKYFRVVHLFSVISLLLFAAAATYLTLDLISTGNVDEANALDSIAARGAFVVDPCAPEVRRAFDKFRYFDDGSRTISAPQCAHAAPLERITIQNIWRDFYRVVFFLPSVSVPMLLLLLVVAVRFVRRLATERFQHTETRRR